MSKSSRYIAIEILLRWEENLLPIDQVMEKCFSNLVLDDPRDHGPLIIHGHTPVRHIEHAGNRVNIDTGAGHGRYLSAVVIEGREVFELTETGRSAVGC